MAKFAPEQWRRVFALLDTALDLPPAQREHWLKELEHSNPQLEPALRELLARHSKHQADEVLPRLPQFARVEVDPRAFAAVHAGEQIGPYRLMCEIGRGSVWLVERADGPHARGYLALYCCSDGTMK